MTNSGLPCSRSSRFQLLRLSVDDDDDFDLVPNDLIAAGGPGIMICGGSGDDRLTAEPLEDAADERTFGEFNLPPPVFTPANHSNVNTPTGSTDDSFVKRGAILYDVTVNKRFTV